jgi:ElaB/YqjD/DUF883 family membrane-anchored ribosome-binding protein
MPRRKTARRKRGGSQDPLAPWIERLQVIRDSGMQPSETHLNQIHQEIMGILAQGGQSSLKDQVFDLLEQIHDLPQGGGAELGESRNIRDELTSILRNLEQIKTTGRKPTQNQLIQIHENLDRFLPQVDALQESSDSNLVNTKEELKSLIDQLFKLLEEVHDLPQGGRRKLKARSRRKTRRVGSSRP